MPLYVFQSSGNPLIRFLIGLATLAVLAGLAFLMLPVVLVIVVGRWSVLRKKLGNATEPRKEDRGSHPTVLSPTE